MIRAVACVVAISAAVAALNAEHTRAVAPSHVRTPAPSTQWDGVFTADQADRGGKTYEERCAACHGAALTGGEMAPPLAGPDFAANWSGVTLGDLLVRIRTSMPLDRPGSLSGQQAADVIAFMLQRNGAPAGVAELPGRADMLQTVTFAATKP